LCQIWLSAFEISFPACYCIGGWNFQLSPKWDGYGKVSATEPYRPDRRRPAGAPPKLSAGPAMPTPLSVMPEPERPYSARSSRSGIGPAARDNVSQGKRQAQVAVSSYEAREEPDGWEVSRVLVGLSSPVIFESAPQIPQHSVASGSLTPDRKLAPHAQDSRVASHRPASRKCCCASMCES